MIIYSKSTPEQIKAWNDRQRAHEESIRSPDFGVKPIPREFRKYGNGSKHSSITSNGRRMFTTY